MPVPCSCLLVVIERSHAARRTSRQTAEARPMTITPTASEFDVIVIGSGMGGMTTATALSRMGHKVLLLEQAGTIGGLTHAFSRDGFTWDVGLHYCGSFGHEQAGGRVLDWLSGGAIEFRSYGTVYDTLHFPDGFEVSVARPVDAYKLELKEHFPDSASEIDAYFEALESAGEAAHLVAAERAMPEPFRSAHRWWNKKKIRRWCGRTTGEVIAEVITDPQLAAVLSAQWGTYGGRPTEGSFGIHATVMNHYLDGAGYPVGGAGAIAKGLVPVIEAAGGGARASTPVSAILVDDGRAVGVRTSAGEELHAPAIVSAIGARETVKRLLPPEIAGQEWAREVAEFRPSICHFQVFLGFEGDIARYGATKSNHWFYESWDTDDGIWSAAAREPVPMLFVSFPSLKDAAHEPGPSNRHTGEAMVWADWSSVAEFANGGVDERPGEWAAFKQDVEDKLMAFFAAKFPALAPLVVHRELGTPFATAAFTGHDKGGFYGVETTPRRLLSEAFNAKTPVPGLFLSGQDVMIPGIAGALWGGMLGAAAVDPGVFRRFRS
ncbi:MAG: NAD(P)/FAD-dependent oxidoreductase [Planctomycetota bacterium]